MPLRSLRARLVLLFLASLTLAALVFAFVAVRRINDYERAKSVETMRQSATAVAEVLARKQNAQLGGDFVRSDAFVPLLRNVAGANRIFFARHNRLPFGTSPLKIDPLPKAYEPLLDWNNQLSKPGRTQAFDMRIGNQEHLAVAAPAFFSEAPDVPVGAVILTRPTESLRTSALVLTERLIPPLALGVLIALLLAAFLGRRVTR